MAYASLDRPEILSHIFCPRSEVFRTRGGSAEDLMIPVERYIHISARVHGADPSFPSILFFHGNGEIAADYDELGPLMNQCGANFVAVDYRGYGRSGGSPTVTTMMTDCHRLYDYLLKWLPQNGLTGPVIVMGRSLGSASALELVASHPEEIPGLVIDSGFAYTLPLLQRLGVDVDRFHLDESGTFGQIQKIAAFSNTVLVIHGEKDVIIPISDGVALYDSCLSEDKTLLRIPEAGHNDIFSYGLTAYMAAIEEIAGKITENSNNPGDHPDAS